MSKLQEILKNPPQKEIECPRCGGRRIINCRGLITSDPCPCCKHSASGKIHVTDYDKFEKAIRQFFKGS